MKVFSLLISLVFQLVYGLTPLNPQIKVDNEIYIQHDKWNNSVYNINKSGKGITVVYKEILPIFTASKIWLRNGTFIDNLDKTPRGATSPQNYIPVKEGEQYFVKLYGDGGIKVNETYYVQLAPVLLLDNNDKYVADFFFSNYSKTKTGAEFTIPKGATRLHITNYNNQGLTLQKIINLTDAEIDKLILEKTMFPKINQTYEEYKKNRIVNKKVLKKAFVAFVNDDTRGNIGETVDLFINKNVPFCLATIPENLIENDGTQKETRLQSIRRLISAGKGEILAHNGQVLIEGHLTNFSALYKTYIRPKKMFKQYGFDVNGIILAGGSGQVTSRVEEEEWASSFYAYSDLYGVELEEKYKNLLDSVYLHSRGGLSNFKNDTEKIKKSIDEAIDKKSFSVYYFHDARDIDYKVLGEVLDYVKQKEKEGKLELGTYSQFYEKYAFRLNDFIKKKTTYYVSSTGTSLEGTSIDAPMSYDNMNSMIFMSGDTIRLKREDTYYGNINFKILKIDNSILTLSTYGGTEKAKPIISGYKIVNKKDSWENHGNSIFKVNLKDRSKFTGVQSIDDNTNKIGFLKDSKENKYFKLKFNFTELKDPYDFFCDGTYLFIKTNGKTPYEELGTLKLATRIYLLMLHSNMKVMNLHFEGTGAHSMDGNDQDEENIEIVHNIIEDIGGSCLKDTTRYGNGIQFYDSNTKNVHIHKNIGRNIYDVFFTIQGNTGSGTNVLVEKNVLVTNSQDSEIWEADKATGVYDYVFSDNLSINPARGWGYDARPDQYPAAHILFWGYYNEKNTKIAFTRNIVYNPRRIYYIANQKDTLIFFKNFNYIESNNNTYYMNNDTYILQSQFKYSERENYIQEYKKDQRSSFILLNQIDEHIINTAKTSINYIQLRNLFFNEKEEKEEDEPSEKNGLGVGVIILIVLICLILVCIVIRFINKKKKFFNEDILKDKFLGLIP